MRHSDVALTALLAVALAAVVGNGCAATRSLSRGTGGGATGGGGTGGAGGVSQGASSSSAGGQGGQGGIVIDPDGGDEASDANDEVITNPCGTQCGKTELCDTAHIGLDDNCNGEVDEICTCTPGQVHWCFKGDPSYHNAPGCYDGVETCSELGLWGPCIGGVQAVPPDNCFLNNTMACHAITTAPYAPVHLETGTGQFSMNALPGSELFSVQCPAGVPGQCPAVMSPDLFTALNSGEYTVTYTKSVAGNPNPLSCTFPLFVGAPGLRVELSWEHFPTDTGVDLDLHVHEGPCQANGETCSTASDCCTASCVAGVCGPAGCAGNGAGCSVNTDCCSGTCESNRCQAIAALPWGVSPAVAQDCTWSNCKVDSFLPPADPNSPTWYPQANAAPQPVNWDDQPNPADNTCYNDVHGVGAVWAALGMGCHNPRSDIDEITCNYAETNPNQTDFCAPENINIDYPPMGQWVRIGVHYYYNHGETYAVHPDVKVFCNGEQYADLGANSFYIPQSAVTFAASQGAGTGQGNVFWVVADVAFTTDSCGNTTCVVNPLYSDPVNLTPYFILDTVAITSFEPAWSPPPQ